ncbi:MULTISPECIES: hypothetical protein [Porphyromonas]|uniref:HTH tetR-type domain-containing protein n=1 Tax=Porphyromonas crevioricanis TaxID=393921 RepID=A0AB34PJN3_9PORP|nr:MULTISPECIES: hypothetical protein [Porphyromonas]KGN66969.1 hypothetical protein JT26_10455 [Porphyromonas sp. COT-108 OH1349]KGN96791.1 hypothetical protein HQ38_00460 [Porphyromonas crevioricanis]
MARRTQRELDQDILRSISSIVLEQGVSGVNFKEVSKRARTEMSVLARRFKDESGMIRYYTQQFDYFINDALAVPSETSCFSNSLEYFRLLATQFEKALHHNKEMQEIMKWELLVNSKTTRQSARKREVTLSQLLDSITAPISEEKVNPNALLAVLVAGLYYLTLREERSTFCGLEFHTKKGRNLLVDTLVTVIEAFLKE